ncbi:helix-turn-helix domain-containing protein [Nocardioides sp. AE5]|uniref:helix-turn-helix domain-containing protein n=1 Tax=Nocardioides sp. AE5 TaxID=2962573 RepID=UPI002882A703|nr:helix-turn-helix domain-containing protein [Nocardioides sp. AE5]MDT0203722.1 helix-turn-helix domain-containing protein [Nocardioides sp. AE5]
MEYPLNTWSRLGPAVRDRRRAAGLTQAELADRAGVSRAWVIRLERGLDNAEPARVLAVLRILGLDLVLREHQVSEDEDLLREVLGE